MEEKSKYKTPRCLHGNIKVYCKDCDSPSICIHKKRKTTCILCNGGSFCEHDKIRARCKQCKGGSICPHQTRKTDCRECGGSSFCEHNKKKSSCKECKGTSICEHDNRRAECKDCKGSSICIHNIRKVFCKSCGGSALCKSSWCKTYGNRKYNGYCLPCCIQICPEIKVSRNYKTKENTVVDIIKEKFPNLTWIADKKIKDGCSNKRPDLLVDMGTHILILEIDENKHSSYDCSCENKRLMLLSQDVGHRPIVFIRFNPDGYIDQEGNTVKSCWKLNQLGVMKIIKTKEKEWAERMNNLIQQIQYWIINPTEKTVEIVELYY